MPVEASARKKLYSQRKKSGLCPRCGSKVRKNSKYIYCEDCRGFFRDYNREASENISQIRKERYDQRKEMNCCPRCGKSLGKRYKKTICATCLDKQYQYNYGRKRPGKK